MDQISDNSGGIGGRGRAAGQRRSSAAHGSREELSRPYLKSRISCEGITMIIFDYCRVFRIKNIKVLLYIPFLFLWLFYDIRSEAVDVDGHEVKILEYSDVIKGDAFFSTINQSDIITIYDYNFTKKTFDAYDQFKYVGNYNTYITNDGNYIYGTVRTKEAKHDGPNGVFWRDIKNKIQKVHLLSGEVTGRITLKNNFLFVPIRKYTYLHENRYNEG